jgi:hypothetical protein
LRTSSSADSLEIKSTNLKPTSDAELWHHLGDPRGWSYNPSARQQLLSRSTDASPVTEEPNSLRDDTDEAEESFFESPVSPAEQTQWFLDCEFDGREITLTPIDDDCPDDDCPDDDCPDDADDDCPDSPTSVWDLRQRMLF